MEAGSLLQEALRRQAEQKDLSEEALWIDVHIVRREEEDASIPYLLQLAQFARHVNSYFQSQEFDWHVGGDGPVFGIHSTDGIPHLRAVCRYGASVADEWAAVEIIRQFTIQAGYGDLAVECWDVQDGHILLIESSDSGLPGWVDLIGPEACRHRCWIRQGQIQLIAPKQQDEAFVSKSESLLNLRQALEVLRTSETDANLVETPHCIQQAIQDCIKRVLPGSSEESTFSFRNLSSYHHKAVVALPRSVAFLFEKRPDLVNAAVVAFAQDALYQLPETKIKPKSKHKDNTTNKENTPSIVCEDWVITTHRFTRTNYAMIRTICSPTWKTEAFIPKEYQSVELRRLQRQCAVEATPHLRHAVSIGVRLAAGLNALLKQTSQESTEASSLKERRALQYWPSLLHNQLGMSSEWIVRAWQDGPHQAVHNLEHVLDCPVYQEELESRPDRITVLSSPETPVPQQIRQLLKKSEQQEARRDYVVPRQKEVDANEDWMVLTNESMEQHFRSRTADPVHRQEEEEKEHTAQLDTMLQGFQSFMVDQSGFEGVATSEDAEPKQEKWRRPGDVVINPRVFLNMLKVVLDPNTSISDIPFSYQDDAFFSNDDYDAMLPEDEETDESDTIDDEMVTLMAAMDEELKGKAAAASGESEDMIGFGPSADKAAEEARVLSNLLQSLDAGSGGSGPVQNMMKAMGQEPPHVTSDDLE